MCLNAKLFLLRIYNDATATAILAEGIAEILPGFSVRAPAISSLNAVVESMCVYVLGRALGRHRSGLNARVWDSLRV